MWPDVEDQEELFVILKDPEATVDARATGPGLYRVAYECVAQLVSMSASFLV